MVSTEALRIPTERQGQTGMGQGGFGCWLLSTAVGRPITTALKARLPLDTELEVRQPATDRWHLVDPAQPEVVLLDAQPWDPDCPETAAVSVAEAAQARERSVANGPSHPAPHCLSCGIGPRSMRVHAGELDDGRYASPLRIPSWAVADGHVDQSLVWMAVDCACGWFVNQDRAGMSGVTVQFAVDVVEPIQADTDYAIVAWHGDYAPEWDGRKRGASAAIFNAAGDCVVQARSFWVRPN